jgi:hypothetical protein
MDIKDLKVSNQLELEGRFAEGFSLPARAAESAVAHQAAKSADPGVRMNADSADMTAVTHTTNIGEPTAPTDGSVAEADSADLAVSEVPEWVEQVFGPRGCWLPVICN